MMIKNFVRSVVLGSIFLSMVGCLSQDVSDYHLGNGGGYIWTDLDDGDQTEEVLDGARAGAIEEVCLRHDPIRDGAEGCYGNVCSLDGQRLECSFDNDVFRDAGAVINDTTVFRLKLSSQHSNDQVYSPYLSKRWLSAEECQNDYIAEEFFEYSWQGGYLRPFLIIRGRFRICDSDFRRFSEFKPTFGLVDQEGKDLRLKNYSCQLDVSSQTDGYFSCRLYIQKGVSGVRLNITVPYMVPAPVQSGVGSRESELTSSLIPLTDYIPNAVLNPPAVAGGQGGEAGDVGDAGGNGDGGEDGEGGGEDGGEANGVDGGDGDDGEGDGDDDGEGAGADRDIDLVAFNPHSGFRSGGGVEEKQSGEGEQSARSVKGGGACSFVGDVEAPKSVWLLFLGMAGILWGWRRQLGR